MKICIKKPIEKSGWGIAADELVKALELLPQSQISEVSPNKDFEKCDVSIHFYIPDNLEWKFDRKNICYIFYETSTLRNTRWIYNLNLMDEVWVSSKWLRDILLNDGVKVPIQVVPIPVDVSKFYKQYDSIIENEGDFLFYWIGDFNKRKNLPAAIRAFHCEFEPYEPVSLVIKASKLQVFHSSYQYPIDKFCQEIRENLKLRPYYKPELIIDSRRLSQEQMLAIHQDCDAFISTSYGEGLNLPCLDALGFGKTPIVNGWGGHREFINNKNGWITDYSMIPAHGMKETVELYTADELWADINVSHLRRNMRECYENKEKRGKLSDRGMKDILKLSYHNIASLIYEQQNQKVQTVGNSASTCS